MPKNRSGFTMWRREIINNGGDICNDQTEAASKKVFVRLQAACLYVSDTLEPTASELCWIVGTSSNAKLLVVHQALDVGVGHAQPWVCLQAASA